MRGIEVGSGGASLGAGVGESEAPLDRSSAGADEDCLVTTAGLCAGELLILGNRTVLHYRDVFDTRALPPGPAPRDGSMEQGASKLRLFKRNGRKAQISTSF